jgi:tRNA nucleotidyltransferase/poly(A) polymerase
MRFGFKITDEIYEAAKDLKVREAFATKITYERIQKEMDKMFEGREGYASLQTMHEFGITSLCIKVPHQIKELQNDSLVAGLLQKSVQVVNVLGILLNSLKQESNSDGEVSFMGHNFTNVIPKDPEWKHFQMCVYYSGLLAPFQPYSFSQKKDWVTTAPLFILKESLKQSNEVQK